MTQHLLAYQEIDKEVRRIEMELGNSDERKKTLTAMNFLKDGEEVVKKADRKSEELLYLYEKLKKSLDEQVKIVAEYETAIKGSLSDNDELSYLAKKINQVMDSLKKIESDLSDVTKEMEENVKNFNDFKKKFAQTKEEYLVYKKKYDELKESKDGEMNVLKDKLSEIAKNIEPARLEKYKARRNDKIFPVLVPLEDGNRCGGCRMELSLNEIGKLKKEQYIECENCKRIIFV